MKKTLTIAGIALLFLAVAITYLGLLRETIFNPPVITGIGFLVLAIVLFQLRTKVK